MSKIPQRNSSVPERNSSIPDRKSSVTRQNLSLPRSPVATGPSDLSKANSKLVAEIFIKNKIIHDMTIENAWKKCSDSPLEKNYGKLFAVLQKINIDLEKAYSVCEQNSINILSLEKQKLLVQEENLYLWSVLEEASIDPELIKLKNVLETKEPARVEALETQLRDAEGKNVELNKQMQYWINVSKKSQESKLIAEASLNVLSSELEKIKRSSKRTSQQIVIHKLEEQLREKEETIMKHLKAQEKINAFSTSLEESYASAEKLENENNDLKENLKLKETLIVDLKEQLSLLIEKEETLLNNEADSDSSKEISKKYDSLSQENQDLVDEKKVLAVKVADMEKENQKLVECLKTESQKIMDYENLLKEARSPSNQIDENEYIELKEKLEANESIIASLREKLEASEAECLAAAYGTEDSDKVQSLEKQLAEALNESKALAQELDSSQATVELQKKELASKESEVLEVLEKLQSLTNQVSAMEKASFIADEKDKQVVELLNQCEKSYADYENKSAELDKLQEEAKAAQLESVELKKELEEQEATLEIQNADIADLKIELQSKEEAIQHFILQYETLEQTNSKLVRELDVYKKSQDSTILEEMESLTKRNMILEEQLNEMLEEQNSIENSSSELSELRLQEKLANQALDVVQAELSESKEEIKKLEAILNDSKSNQEILQRKIEYYSEKLEKYEKQLETADEIVASSNSTHAEAQNFLEKYESSEKRNKILEEELVRVVLQLEATQKKFEAVGEKDDNSSGDDTRHSLLQAELEEKIKELSILEHEHKSLGTLFSILKAELDAKDSDSKTLKQSLDLSMKELEEEKNIVNDMKGEFKEIESLKNITISDKKAIQELSRMLSLTSERNSKLEVVIKKLEKDFIEMQKQENSKDSAIDEQVAYLEKEIEAQLVAIKRSDDEAKELKAKYLKEKQENESLTDFIKQADVPALLIRVGFLEKQSSEYESKTAELLAEKSAIESRLADSEALILKLQDEISAQDGSVFQAPQVLIEKQQMIDELSQLNESLFKKIETLSRKLEDADSARPNTMRPGDSGLEAFIIASQKQAEEAERAIEALSNEVAKAYEKINALVGEKADLEEEVYNLTHR